MKHRQYNTGKNEKKRYRIIYALLAVIIAALLAMNICTAEEPAWDTCYEMTNRKIEWTYAGR